MAAIAADPAAGGLPQPVLETERLILRPLRDSDLDAIAALADDAEIAAMTLAIPHPFDRSAGQWWINQSHQERAAGEAVTYAVTRKEDGAFLGGLSLTVTAETRTGLLGYWLGRPFWNQGMMTEAVRRILFFAFDALDLVAVEAAALPENTASLRVMEKLGLTDHRLWDRVLEDGSLRRSQVRRVARADFLAAQPARRTVLVVAVALIDGDGRVLLAQRPEGKALAGLWEFPGGKVAPGETPEAALIRELREELGIDVSASCLAPFTFASHTYADFHLLMPLYVCRVWKGEVRGAEGQALAWVAPNRMRDYPMPPADKPLVAMLRDLV